MSDILGAGLAFPIGLDARRRFAMTHGERKVEDSIMMIVLTPKGQRVMHPEFGCQIHDLIFALNDATTAGLAARYVQEALETWEPRIEVHRVTAMPDPIATNRLLIQIDYEIRATHERRSKVFPFYRLADE
jgi:phage baseplate assembly protein W